MKAVKYLLLAAVIAGGLLALNLQAQDTGKERKGGKRPDAQARLNQMGEQLSLTAEQKEKIKVIFEAEREKYQGLRDLTPERAGNARLVDCESGATHDALVDAAAIERYDAALRRHQENWSDEARRGEAVMLTMTAEDVLDGWRVAPLAQRGILERRRTA